MPERSRFSRGTRDPQWARKKPTINDVARLAGVSKKTVSRVINHSPLVRSETRETIARVMTDIGYAPDPQARGLAFRHSFLIGMIYDNPNPQYIVNMQQGLLEGLRGSGFELLVHPCDRQDPELLDEVRAFVERQKLFGVVLTPSVSEDEAVVEVLRDVGCEYIRVASVLLDNPERMIVSNDHVGGRVAAHHLVELGHTRVAFISGPQSFRSSHERRRGFEAGLADHGLELLSRFDALGAYTFASGVECGRKLMRYKPRPTAIFAGNDEMAAGVLQAARMEGLGVPDDLSVVGFDDFQIATSVWPRLTSVHSPTIDVGRTASRKLIRRFHSGAEAVPEAEETLPTLVVRESSGPVPKGI